MTDSGADTNDERVLHKPINQEPEILDVVEAPRGGECELLIETGTHVRVCGDPADHLFVYDGVPSALRDRRRNALACSECFNIDNYEGEL